MERQEAMHVLGLSDDMAENIKMAYFRLSKENHPDTGGDPEVFKNINEAYRVLSEISPPPPNRQEILNLEVHVSLEEAIFGVVLETYVRPTAISSQPMIGDGKSSAHAQVIAVVERIPPMVLLQMGTITFSHKNQMLNGSPRTINITYAIRKHERYKPHTDKSVGLLEADEKIPVTTALYGGTVEVATLFGIRKLYIRPGTNIGDSYEIKNHGHLGSLVVNIAGMEMPVIHDMESDSLAVPEKVAREIEEEEREIRVNMEKAGVKTSSGSI